MFILKHCCVQNTSSELKLRIIPKRYMYYSLTSVWERPSVPHPCCWTSVRWTGAQLWIQQHRDWLSLHQHITSQASSGLEGRLTFSRESKRTAKRPPPCRKLVKDRRGHHVLGASLDSDPNADPSTGNYVTLISYIIRC